MDPHYIHVLYLDDIVLFEYVYCSTRMQTLSDNIFPKSRLEVPLTKKLNGDSDLIWEYHITMRYEE